MIGWSAEDGRREEERRGLSGWRRKRRNGAVSLGCYQTIFILFFGPIS